ncbi:hypothetical protein [Henriciella marina]|uniref:hypothetical protein n=1 Tax=Henriciella marina TaxID=453851 RepID=UPI000373A4B9|nr:hypothetical protein [Henriciella marina]
MKVLSVTKDWVKRSPLVHSYIWARHRFSATPQSQSNEANILNELTRREAVPRSFVEFGFSGWEFNCIGLARNLLWEGLLLDGGDYNVKTANQIYHDGIVAKRLWITRETLDVVSSYAQHRDLGILSIDVDGNDYWFLKDLIHLRPAIIVSEFNVSFGKRPLTVPYDPNFDRMLKHSSGEYYGASITALDQLCRLHGYSLMSVSANGVNAFFMRDDLLNPEDEPMNLDTMKLLKRYPDGSKAPTAQFWEQIKHLPFVDVTGGDSAGINMP